MINIIKYASYYAEMVNVSISIACAFKQYRTSQYLTFQIHFAKIHNLLCDIYDHDGVVTHGLLTLITYIYNIYLKLTSVNYVTEIHRCSDFPPLPNQGDMKTYTAETQAWNTVNIGPTIWRPLFLTPKIIYFVPDSVY